MEGISGFYRMSILSSIDASQHTTPLSLLQLGSDKLTTTAQEVDKNAKLETPNIAALNRETPKVDLNNYYSNVQSPEFKSDIYSNLVQAEHNFSDTVMSAIENGMNPQDAANIQMAKAAYVASMKVAEKSTFELMI